MNWWFATYWLGYGMAVVSLERWARRVVWMAHPILTWSGGLVGAFAWPLIAPVVLFVRVREAYRGRDQH